MKRRDGAPPPTSADRGVAPSRSLPLSIDTLILLLIASSLTRLALMTRLVPVDPDPRGLMSDNQSITKWFVLSLMVFGVFAYVMADIWSQVRTAEAARRWVLLTKWVVVLMIVLVFDVTSTITWIQLRHGEGPERHIHDGALQVEEAIKLLLTGRNPYGFDYSSTPMYEWQGLHDNPALHHFVYLPFLTLCSAPLHLLSRAALGWYDQRFVILLCILGCVIVLPKLARTMEGKLSAVMLGLLNPSLALYLPEGRNDVFTLFWLLLSLAALQGGRVLVAAALMGLTFASKQSAWPMAPFFLAYVWWRHPEPHARLVGRLRNFPWKATAALTVPFAACVLPFLCWDFNAFVDDTIRYQTGTTAHSFPIRGLQGYGFGSAVLIWGWVKQDTDYFPFWIFQALAGLPLLALLLRWQQKGNSIARMLIGYGLLLFVTQYFARAFHDNYWGYIVTIVGLGVVMGMEDGGVISDPVTSDQ